MEKFTTGDPTNTKETVSPEIERQFKESHYLELENGEKLKYTVVKPTQETEDTEWVMIIGGFSSTKEMWEEEIKDLAKKGKRVVFATPDKGIEPDEEQATYFQNEGKTIPPTIQNKAVTIKKLLDHLGISRTNMVGQSQGGPIAASLAGMYPNLIKQLLLDSPAGIANQPVPIFLARAATNAAVMKAKSEIAKLKEVVSGEEVDPELAAKDSAQWKEYEEKQAKDFKWRLLHEIPEIGKSNILPVLEDIENKKRTTKNKFPEIILLTANDDNVFPAKNIENNMGLKYKENLTKEEAESFLKYVDRWVMYVDPKMGHGKYKRPTPGVIPEVFKTDRQEKGRAIATILDQKHD